MSDRVRRQRGLSLVEVVMAVAVLGVALPPVVSIYRQISLDSVDASHDEVAFELAESMLEEIASKSFADPDGAPDSFGTEEADRADFDDVDDYDRLIQAPPRLMDGTSPVMFTGMTCRVIVENVNPSAPDAKLAQPDGSTLMKRIEVTVARRDDQGGDIVLTTLRTQPELLDPLQVIDEDAAESSAVKAGTRAFVIEVTNTTDIPRVIDHVELTSESAAGLWNISRLMLDGRDMWSGAVSIPSGVVTMTAGEDDRTIGANRSATMQVVLAANPSGSHEFDLVLIFADGSGEHVTFTVDW